MTEREWCALQQYDVAQWPMPWAPCLCGSFDWSLVTVCGGFVRSGGSGPGPLSQCSDSDRYSSLGLALPLSGVWVRYATLVLNSKARPRGVHWPIRLSTKPARWPALTQTASEVLVRETHAGHNTPLTPLTLRYGALVSSSPCRSTRAAAPEPAGLAHCTVHAHNARARAHTRPVRVPPRQFLVWELKVYTGHVHRVRRGR